jgi:hypothetical protein
VYYDAPPEVIVSNADGSVIGRDDVEVVTGKQEIELAIPVVEEVWLTKPVSRAELRMLCDRHATRQEIATALRSVK